MEPVFHEAGLQISFLTYHKENVMKYLGIDVSKDKFDVALLEGKQTKHKTFSNNDAGFNRLLDWLGKINKIHACMEATGRYGDQLAKFLHIEGFKVSVVNAACVKFFAKSLLRRNKTDKADALVIAKFCQSHQPELWEPTPEAIQELIELTRRITHLQSLRQAEINHKESGICSKGALESAEKIIQVLDQELEELASKIRQIIDSDDDLKKQKELLKTIPGISDRTSEIILSEIKGEIAKFESAKSLAAYAGITPKTSQSGTSLNSRGRISKLGNKTLRTALYLPAIVAKKHNFFIKVFCQRLSDKGKRGKQIICAAIRKLLHIIYGVLKSGKPFDPNYQNSSFST